MYFGICIGRQIYIYKLRIYGPCLHPVKEIEKYIMVGTPTNIKFEWSWELFLRRNSSIDKPFTAVRTFRCFIHRHGLFCSMKKTVQENYHVPSCTFLALERLVISCSYGTGMLPQLLPSPKKSVILCPQSNFV
jgi:hypothetical protein